jgi:hypothetical protein
LGSPTSNTTDQLIARLVAEAAPVKRLFDPRTRAAVWTALALVCIALGAAWFGVRDDLAGALTFAPFLLRVALLVATMWLAVVTALRLSVPGADQRAWTRWWPLLLLGALVAVTAAELGAVAAAGEMGSPLRAWTCVRKLTYVGALPALAAIVLIRRAAPIDPVWTALLGLVASGAAGALTSEIACPIRAPMHVMLWHVLPIAVYAAIGGLAVWLVVRLRRLL